MLLQGDSTPLLGIGNSLDSSSSKVPLLSGQRRWAHQDHDLEEGLPSFSDVQSATKTSPLSKVLPPDTNQH